MTANAKGIFSTEIFISSHKNKIPCEITVNHFDQLDNDAFTTNWVNARDIWLEMSEWKKPNYIFLLHFNAMRQLFVDY